MIFSKNKNIKSLNFFLLFTIVTKKNQIKNVDLASFSTTNFRVHVSDKLIKIYFKYVPDIINVSLSTVLLCAIGQ